MLHHGFVYNVEHLPSYVAIGATEDCVNKINNPDIKMVIWKRPSLPDDLSSSLNNLVQSDDFLFTALKHSVINFPTYKINNLPTAREIAVVLSKSLSRLEIIAEDLSQLFGAFVKRTSATREVGLEVRLEVRRASTEVFHVDFLHSPDKVRGIMAYHGNGPDWAEDEGIIKRNGKNLAWVDDGNFIHQTGAMEACLMQGGENGLFHRPHSATQIQKRILAVMNPV